MRRVVHRDHDGREVAAEIVVERAAGDLERAARLEPGVEVGAQRVAHQRGASEGAAAVAGDVADDDRDALVVEEEGVVEVAAGGRAVGRAVGDRGLKIAELLRDLREQRLLQQADVLEQLLALAVRPLARRAISWPRPNSTTTSASSSPMIQRIGVGTTSTTFSSVCGMPLLSSFGAVFSATAVAFAVTRFLTAGFFAACLAARRWAAWLRSARSLRRPAGVRESFLTRRWAAELLLDGLVLLPPLDDGVEDEEPVLGVDGAELAGVALPLLPLLGVGSGTETCGTAGGLGTGGAPPPVTLPTVSSTVPVTSVTVWLTVEVTLPTVSLTVVTVLWTRLPTGSFWAA